MKIHSPDDNKNSSSGQHCLHDIFISFIILTINSEKYLDLCLNSIISQKFSRFEIIIVDGGSTDKTLQIINNYTKKFREMKLIRAPGSSIGYAREIGTKQAIGDICAYIDSDCELPSDSWLSSMISGFDSPAIAAVWTLGTYHIHDVSILRYSILSNPFRNNVPPIVTKRNYIPVGTGHILIRKEIIQKVGGFRDLNAAEDIDLTYKIVNHGYQIRYMKGCEVFHYHVTSLRQLIHKNRRNISGGMNSQIWKRTYLSPRNLDFFLSLTIVYPIFYSLYRTIVDKDWAWLWHPVVTIFKIFSALSVFLCHVIPSQKKF
ncbi:MAG: glycosyltransferase [Methanolinea sp.]|jgi:glycosyltransferase involved in cell wall biosynthesis|nr:glycosyltransferase [Methanolinea sp.]